MNVTPPDAKSDGTLFGGVTNWYQEPSAFHFSVMAISVISVSSDSSEDSVGTLVGRVILFDTYHSTYYTTIPDYTPASPDYSLASDTEFDPSEDPSSNHIPPLPAISPFLSSTNDTTDSDTPNTPPSPSYGTPFTETTLSTRKSPTTSGALQHRFMVLAPGQPISYGRPYRYHLNGLVHMMTVRKRVEPLPTHRLAVRHSVDYSSSDHFSSDDSSSDSSSSSSLETSSDSLADALSDSASSHSSFDHSLPASPSGTRSSHRLCSLVPSVHRSSAISKRPSHDPSFASRSRKRSRSHVAFVPLSSPTLGALSYARADLLPSLKRIRSPKTDTDLEDCSEDRFEPYIDECFIYADALRDREIDARVVVEAVDREESETGMRGLVEVRVERVTLHVMPKDTPKPAQEGAVEVTYETLVDLVQRFPDHTEDIPVYRIHAIEGVQREQGCRIIGAELAVTVLTERVAELERDNRRLRGTASVESCRKMPNTRSGASRTREAVNEQSDRRMAEALRVHDAVKANRDRTWAEAI
ncbi:hypothetical protein Tco_1065015 [Tanacetum coccineum]